MKNMSVNEIDKLSETAMKKGSYNFLLALVAFILISLMSGLGWIIKQNSDAIRSMPKDIALLSQKFESMDKKMSRLYEMDKKIDMLFYDRFGILNSTPAPKKEINKNGKRKTKI